MHSKTMAAGRLLALVMACTALHGATAMSSTPRTLLSLSREGTVASASVVGARHQVANQTAHHWPHVRGHPGTYGTTPLHGPADLAKDLSWSWHHPDGRYNTVMLGGALIDSDRNIYVFTVHGIFKLSPTGQQLWNYTKRATHSNVGSILGDTLFGNSEYGWVFALSLKTGQELWARKIAKDVGGDCAYVESHAGVVVTAANAGQNAGNWNVFGLNASDGSQLWSYQLYDQVVYNIMAMFPDNDTTVFMDATGGVYKLGLQNGTELWHVQAPGGNISFSDGGLILGPDGDIYTCSNPAGMLGEEGEQGALRRYALANGSLLWDVLLPYPCNSWPAVSADGGTVVVVPGSFVEAPLTFTASITGALGKPASVMDVTLFHSAVMAEPNQRKAFGMPELRAAIMAFNATTGAQLWRHNVANHTDIAAKGDEEGFPTRFNLGMSRPLCFPAHWSSPTIDADGTVFVGRTNGKLYRYSPTTGESTYTTGTGPLHSGVTFAPGLMAYTDCDSLYVFKI